jgi:hypothetical protein
MDNSQKPMDENKEVKALLSPDLTNMYCIIPFIKSAKQKTLVYVVAVGDGR